MFMGSLHFYARRGLRDAGQHPHFTGGETEAQKEMVTSLKSHSYLVAKPVTGAGSAPRPVLSSFQFSDGQAQPSWHSS